eukprot:snap_masked-scaffold_5-processed-gene-19.33-mRNA-1 protein AED:1.00 eAED:1.00 QI:0/-1/0/0/-1/1/1/0/73
MELKFIVVALPLVETDTVRREFKISSHVGPIIKELFIFTPDEDGEVSYVCLGYALIRVTTLKWFETRSSSEVN